MTKVLVVALLSIVATAGAVTLGACGDTAPTQEDVAAQYFKYDQAGQVAGRCKISPPFGKGPTCDDCRNKSCCALYKSCERDKACAIVTGCASDCLRALSPQTPDAQQYTSCINACYQATPEGAASYAAMSTCPDACKPSCQ